MNVLQPFRARHSGTIRLNGTIAEIMPMLCPVREVEWVTDWDPYVVYSTTGVAEDGCVFTTREGDVESVWVMTRHDEAAGVVEIVKHTPGSTLAQISVELRDAGDGATEAEIAYTHTALGPDGRKVVQRFTEDSHREFLDRWERELNHYLGRGDG